MTKLRIAFTVEEEMLFGMVAKLLPIENLHIGEVTERLPQERSKVAARIQAALDKPRAKRAPRGSGPNLKAGINSIIIHQLSDGPRSAEDMKAAIKKGGYSMNSTGSRLEELRKFGIVERVGDGTWKLVEKQHDKSAA